MSMEAGLPALALIFLLGMRHGLEPDHLAAVDGLTLRSQATHARWTPWMGALFALGHGVCVLAIVAVAALASRQFTPSPNLFAWLEWLPIALLLMIAAMNARSLLAGAQLAEVRGRLLPSWLRGASGPLGAILVGMLFALVFDTALQAAAWGYAAVALGGMGPALLTGTVFAVGMGVTDTFDGWVTAKVMRTGNLVAARKLDGGTGRGHGIADGGPVRLDVAWLAARACLRRGVGIMEKNSRVFPCTHPISSSAC